MPLGLNMTISRWRRGDDGSGEAEALQVENERNSGGADAEVAEEFAAGSVGRHGDYGTISEPVDYGFVRTWRCAGGDDVQQQFLNAEIVVGELLLEVL